jgi:spore germination protein YaaH
MGYDEHWATSEESGSVASIGFVERGILDTLKEVQKEKVILGLPYYTRRWKEQEVDGLINVSSEAYSMNRAKKVLDDNDAEIVWNDEVKQYYGDYKKDNTVYKIWLEEERSIEEKVKLVIENDIAGVAGWRIGLEKDEIWDVLYDYLKK